MGNLLSKKTKIVIEDLKEATDILDGYDRIIEEYNNILNDKESEYREIIKEKDRRISLQNTLINVLRHELEIWTDKEYTEKVFGK